VGQATAGGPVVPLERTQDGPTGGHDLTHVHGALIERTYRVLHDDLVRFCAGRGASPGRAEDIAQETFARATEHARATGDVPRWPWLMVTARRLLRDLDQRRSATPSAPDGLQVEDPTADPAELAVTAEDHRWLRDRLAELPAAQRDALVLEDRGWSTREVALLLGVSEGCVRQLRRRARTALQAAWGDRDALGGVALLPVFGQRAWDRLRAAAARARDRVMQLDASSLAASSDVAGAAVAAVFVGMALGGPAAATTPTMPPAATPSVVHLAGVVPTSEAGPVPPSEASTVLDAAVRTGPAGAGPVAPAATETPSRTAGSERDLDVAVTPSEEVPGASGASMTIQGESRDGTRRLEDAHQVPAPAGGPVDGHGEVTVRCEGITGSTACAAYDVVIDAEDGAADDMHATEPARLG
jgi:RNA polymerase sigma-70 factor, ECF subfamily